MKTKKRLLSILLSLALVLGLVPGMSLTAFADGTPAYSGGTGTEADPYLISTADDWKALATAVNGGTNYSGNYFKQTANLDMSGAGNLEPVGTLTASFAGNYDGCGFAISGAKIEGVSSTVSGQKYMVAGAFGVLEGGGSVTNLRVKNSEITANTTEYSQAYAGGIAAIVEKFSVTDCCVMDSTIKANATGRAAFCGGIVGFAQSNTGETTTFKRCASEKNTITTDATNNQVGYGGGFVGAIINQSGLTFTDCYSAKNTISSSNRTMNGAFCGGHQMYGNATLTNGFVYGCTVTTGENGIASLFGYESDSTKYSVSATNTYYYDTQSLPVNASATSATADEMKSLKSSLGDAFFQGDDYPVLQHSIRIGVTAEDRVYGEDAEEPSVTGNSSDGTVTFQYKTKDAEDSTYSETVPTDVGEYTVKVTVKETDHFKGGEATANFTITKANATVTTAPKAETLTYNEKAQELVTKGEAEGGEMQYVLGSDATTAPTTGYATSIPTATDAGTYYVWYKVAGDKNHKDSEPACVTVKIAEKPAVSAAKPVLAAKAIAKGKTAAKLSWSKVSGAAKYEIYMSRCGKTAKKVKTLSAAKSTWTKKKLKKKSTYKFYVVAKDASGNVISQSLTGHAITGNVKGNKTNAKSLKLSQRSFTLIKGGTAKVSATQKKAKKGKKLLSGGHAALLRYTSDNPAVATVSADGTITAVGAGSCTVYVQTVNGIWKTAAVNVK